MKTEIFISFIEGTERAKSIRMMSATNIRDISANLKKDSLLNDKNGIRANKKIKRDMILGALGKRIFTENFKNSKIGKTHESKNKRATTEKRREEKILTAVHLLFKSFTPPLTRQGANRNKGIAVKKANKNPEKE